MMSTKLFMTNLLKRVPLNFSESVIANEKYTAAAVACVMRLSSSDRSTDFQCPQEILEHIESGTIEILFIKRAHRGGDRWGGDTAFPGGFLNVNESDKEGVQREAWEELGLRLDDSKKYAWLGRLKHITLGDKDKVIIPHVFLYLGHEGPIFNIETSEVASVAWVSMSSLLCRSPTQLDAHSVKLDKLFSRFSDRHKVVKKMIVGFAALFSCSTVHFPCVMLPVVDASSPQPPSHSLSSATTWALWGMTFRFISDLLEVGNGCRPYYLPALPFWVDNRYFNMTLHFWNRFIDRSNKNRSSLLLSLSLLSFHGVWLTGLGVCSYHAASPLLPLASSL
jgi:8-oxo-dGTP pyrophosphatase MutT (NUDIX family)